MIFDGNDVTPNFKIGYHVIRVIGDDEKQEGSISTHYSMQPNQIFPNADQLRLLRESKVIKRLPYISERDTADKTRGDALITTIAHVQVSYLLISLITRCAKYLPVTQLEIATLAFSTCTFIIYLLFCSKPQGITTTIDVMDNQPIWGGDLNQISGGIRM